MTKLRDLAGQTFGKLTVVSLLPARTKGGKAQWRCRCACGGWSPCVIGGDIARGHTTSCGCEQRSSARETGKSKLKHGLSGQTGNAHYIRWQGIKARTSKPNATGYANYGGRGIKFYEPWARDFISFKSWLDDNLGPCPEGWTLDRIDNNGNYEAGNLRWASAETQISNQRKAK